MMPWRLAYWPVRIDARLGEQIGVVWNARSKRTPSRDAIDVRRLHVRMPSGAEFIEAEVVDQDDEEVRLAGHAHCVVE